MKSVFVLTYGWRDGLDSTGEPLREMHASIDSAEKSGENFLAAEERFSKLTNELNTAYYKIERFNFDVVISERML